jgi:hypothetical protein
MSEYPSKAHPVHVKPPTGDLPQRSASTLNRMS